MCHGYLDYKYVPLCCLLADDMDSAFASHRTMDYSIVLWSYTDMKAVYDNISDVLGQG